MNPLLDQFKRLQVAQGLYESVVEQRTTFFWGIRFGRHLRVDKCTLVESDSVRCIRVFRECVVEADEATLKSALANSGTSANQFAYLIPVAKSPARPFPIRLASPFWIPHSQIQQHNFLNLLRTSSIFIPSTTTCTTPRGGYSLLISPIMCTYHYPPFDSIEVARCHGTHEADVGRGWMDEWMG